MSSGAIGRAVNALIHRRLQRFSEEDRSGMALALSLSS
jgi:hypothetical protein